MDISHEQTPVLSNKRLGHLWIWVFTVGDNVLEPVALDTLGSFQLLAIINKAAMNIVEHVSFLPVGGSSDLVEEPHVNNCPQQLLLPT